MQIGHRIAVAFDSYAEVFGHLRVGAHIYIRAQLTGPFINALLCTSVLPSASHGGARQARLEQRLKTQRE